MRIVFHGENAATYVEGFAELLPEAHDIAVLSDGLGRHGERETFANAEVIVGTRLNPSHPRPERVQLYQVAAAGYDGVDLSLLPGTADVCNCFGHETAIAEYVMGGLLAIRTRLIEADRRLRGCDWTFQAGRPAGLHRELTGTALGLVGYGHIGKAIARRAKAFDLTIHVANRSQTGEDELVDRYWPLDQLGQFVETVDTVVVSLPLTPTTTSLIDGALFARMKRDAIVVNVGRGPVVDEAALYDALKTRKIAGALIDTWYVYPGKDDPAPHPSRLAFHELDNVIMTPHMSAWTWGTIRRRQETMATNITRLGIRLPLLNIVRPSGTDT
jgi:phosphoglycerate dehydrogenase-like enzyme